MGYNYYLTYALGPLKRRGISIEVRDFNVKQKGTSRKVEPETDGFLLSRPVYVPSQFILAIRLPRDLQDAWVVSVYDRDGKIAVKTKDYTPNSSYKTFAKIISNRPTDLISEQGIVFLSTKHDGNNLRLILTDNGIFEMWEIAIPTRAVDDMANYFLTVQKLYSGKMYNLDGRVYINPNECRIFSEWAHLKNFLNQAVNVDGLPSANELDEFLEQVGEVPTIASGSFHRVKYFCLASGLGKVETHRGDAFVHWTDIISSDRFVFLEAGQLVSGEIIHNGKGLQLVKISAVG